MNISNKEKQDLLSEANLFYVDKGIKLISKYFSLLDDKEYNEAFSFLKGDKGKYFNKTRMNTFLEIINK